MEYVYTDVSNATQSSTVRQTFLFDEYHDSALGTAFGSNASAGTPAAASRPTLFQEGSTIPTRRRERCFQGTSRLDARSWTGPRIEIGMRSARVSVSTSSFRFYPEGVFANNPTRKCWVYTQQNPRSPKGRLRCRAGLFAIAPAGLNRDAELSLSSHSKLHCRL